MTEKVISHVIGSRRNLGIPTAVDPKRKNFFAYAHADIFKPNLHEAKDALNLLSVEVTEDSLSGIHALLHEKLEHRVSFITLSEKGCFTRMVPARRSFPTYPFHSGCQWGRRYGHCGGFRGFAVTGNVHLMADVANIAGGLGMRRSGHRGDQQIAPAAGMQTSPAVRDSPLFTRLVCIEQKGPFIDACSIFAQKDLKTYALNLDIFAR